MSYFLVFGFAWIGGFLMGAALAMQVRHAISDEIRRRWNRDRKELDALRREKGKGHADD